MTVKGKNFSANNLGQRKKSDFYETPFSLTEQILDRESLSGSILEPACGRGAIVKVLQARGFKDITCYDAEVDFLTEQNEYDNLITNPPFSLSFQFIIHAKQVIRNKIILLLPLSYLHGKKRHDLIYSDRLFPLARVYIFTRYPMLGESLREDGKYNTGMMVYAWYVWDKLHANAEPVIRWIDNNPFVLSKKDKK